MSEEYTAPLTAMVLIFVFMATLMHLVNTSHLADSIEDRKREAMFIEAGYEYKNIQTTTTEIRNRMEWVKVDKE